MICFCHHYRNTKLLSFGEEADQENAEVVTTKKKNLARPDCKLALTFHGY